MNIYDEVSKMIDHPIIKPSADDYKKVQKFINTLTYSQCHELYILYIQSLPSSKMSVTSAGIFIDLELLSDTEFWGIVKTIFTIVAKKEEDDVDINIHNAYQNNPSTPDCDYSKLYEDLQLQPVDMKSTQPIISNYLELYDIQRYLPTIDDSETKE